MSIPTPVAVTDWDRWSRAVSKSLTDLPSKRDGERRYRYAGHVLTARTEHGGETVVTGPAGDSDAVAGQFTNDTDAIALWVDYRLPMTFTRRMRLLQAFADLQDAGQQASPRALAIIAAYRYLLSAPDSRRGIH